ncbi:DUF835 domain-containing protein [Thermococcus barophilus]|uniref:DUF835 domain-containing protein n=1 Tax=Thermococcus barophilus TaxID=55802 RepID=A0A0S1XE58_THEBA|nr:DUF835 domain-containing protein [Thermococcus barophilus]ALM76079.1 conserved membrane hypothetical protein [Thermococcus barophilus]
MISYVRLFLGIAFLSVYALFFYKWHKTRKTSFLPYSLSWLVLSIHYLLDENISMFALFIFSSFMWMGNVELLFELNLMTKHREIGMLGVVPMFIYFLFFSKSRLVVYLLAGIFIIVSSLPLLIKGTKFLRYLGALQAVFGIATAVFPFYSNVLYIHALIAFGIAYISIMEIIDIITLENLLVEAPALLSIEMEPGIIILSNVPDEVLENALVFSREKRDRPGWFWITKVNSSNSIYPTDLAKIVDISVRYMNEMKRLGKKPVIVIDNLEYLILENGFESVLKFLTTLRDHALLTSAFIFVEVDPDALSKKEMGLLKRLTG